MDKSKLLFLTLASGFALALAAPAAAEGFGKGPCAGDAAKFCKDVKPGGGRVAACLKEHEKELSKACTERRALAAGRRGAGGRAWKRGGGACAAQYGRGFNAGFRNGFRMRGGLGAARTGGRPQGAGACAADAKKLCGDVKPGEGRVKACLLRNLDRLSDGCKARQERFKERDEKKG